MNEKKLKKLNNEPHDDDFERMFQKFLDDPDDSDDLLDDSDYYEDDADTDELKQDNAEHEQHRPEDRAVALLKENAKTNSGKAGEPVSPFALSFSIFDDEEETGYRNAPVKVCILTKDDVLPSPDRFKCSVYTTDYFPMCSSEEKCEVRRNGNELTYELPCDHIWMPGAYVLLVRDKGQADALVRMEFFIDDNLNVFYDDASYAQLCGIDDVLTCCVARAATWHQLATLPGFRQMRQKILKHEQFALYNEVRKDMNAEPLLENSNFIFCTRNRDLTRNDIDNFRGQMRIQHPLEYLDCSTRYDPTCNNPYEHLGELLLTLNGRVVCLTHLGALLTTGGKTIVKRILDEVRDSQPYDLLWLCGNMQEIKALLEQFPSMKDFYTRDSWIVQESYTDFELVQAFFGQLKKEHLEASNEVKDQVTRAIIQGCLQGPLSSWSLSDIRGVIAEDIRPRYVQRTLKNLEFDEIPALVPEDIDTSLFAPTSDTFQECMAELNAMVGLDEVKQGITTMANNTRFYLKRRQQGLHTSGNVAYHCIFTGNPGTGKTTVARQLGRLYRSLGLLSRGEVIAVDRTRLVGRYIGETEENMKAVLEEARGNVLFIDEASNLYDGSGDRKDFGARVIDSLLTVLSQPNPDMLIVFAGYEKEMDAMLNTNPGLTGRFPYKYRFADYTADQLMEIATRLLEWDQYILSDEAAAVLRDSIVYTLSQRTSNFGNARWVEQYIRNGIIPAMADRLAATGSEDYRHIEASDVRKAYEKFNPKAVELKPRRKVGFSA